MNDCLKPDKIITIPNVLSLIRILLVPVFVINYFWDFKNHFYYAAATLILSGLTDVADGVIARRFNMITTFGKIIDPIADKLTQCAAVACLAIRHTYLIPLLILLFAKEFSMLLGAVRLLKKGLRPSESKWWGKLSTVMVFALFMVVLLSDIFSIIPQYIPIALAVLASICLLFSLFNYYPIFKEIENGEYDIESERGNKDK